MAKVKTNRKSGKPPITRHPLFPATVALWFGALFGIGSLAIRPGLIEAIIVAMKIDAAIPAAAPPIGATGHTLIALVFAGLGGLLGARLARRIARPKPVATERKRGAGPVRTAPAAQAAGMESAGRRGRLAFHDEPTPSREYVEPAPLPGGANILDVSQFDLEGFEASIPEQADMSLGLDIPDKVDERGNAASGQPEREQTEPEAQTIAAFWRREPEPHDIREGAQVFQPDVTQTAAAETARTAPAFDAVMPDAEATSRSPEAGEDRFRETGEGAARRFDEPAQIAEEATAPCVRPAPPETARQDTFAAPNPPFENEPVIGSDEPEMAPLARLDDETPGQFEPNAPWVRPGSIFDQKPAQALFAQPLQASVSSIAWDAGPLEPTGASAGFAPQVATQAHSVPAAVAPEPVADTASQRIASAPLDELSHVELLERLALTMRRKRQQAAPVVQSEPEQATQPLATRPSADPVIAAQAQYDAPSAPPIPVIPAALRPVGLGEDDDDDAGELLPVFVPPRHFGQAPIEDAEPAKETGDAFSQPEPSPVDETASEQVDELDEGYSSLLNLSRPGTGIQRFVRIEEPQAATTEIEPAVVFPGKETGRAEGPFAQPAAPAAVGDGRQHPLDVQPAGPGEEPAFQAPATRPDPEETDRALRAALANIQRMSGAA